MRVVNLACNECGAPLVVPKSANYVTCEFCGAQLHVVREGGVAYTEIHELAERTERLEDDMARLKASEALNRLDADWQQEMKKYEVRQKNGEASIPSKQGAVFGAGVAAAFGVVWMIFAGGLVAGSPFGFAAVFPLFGLVFIVAAIGTGVMAYQKAEAYELRKAQYERERRKIIEAIRGEV